MADTGSSVDVSNERDNILTPPAPPTLSAQGNQRGGRSCARELCPSFGVLGTCRARGLHLHALLHHEVGLVVQANQKSQGLRWDGGAEIQVWTVKPGLVSEG